MVLVYRRFRLACHLLVTGTLSKYVLAIILPPLAVLVCGRPLAALVNLLLVLCFWIPGVIHALIVVRNDAAEHREYRFVRDLKKHPFSMAVKKA